MLGIMHSMNIHSIHNKCVYIYIYTHNIHITLLIQILALILTQIQVMRCYLARSPRGPRATPRRTSNNININNNTMIMIITLTMIGSTSTSTSNNNSNIASRSPRHTTPNQDGSSSYHSSALIYHTMI